MPSHRRVFSNTSVLSGLLVVFGHTSNCEDVINEEDEDLTILADSRSMALSHSQHVTRPVSECRVSCCDSRHRRLPNQQHVASCTRSAQGRMTTSHMFARVRCIYSSHAGQQPHGAERFCLTLDFYDG